MSFDIRYCICHRLTKSCPLDRFRVLILIRMASLFGTNPPKVFQGSTFPNWWPLILKSRKPAHIRPTYRASASFIHVSGGNSAVLEPPAAIVGSAQAVVQTAAHELKRDGYRL